MTRIASVAEEDVPTLSALVTRIREQRNGKFLKLYQVLLHAPPLAEAWLQFFTVIRQQCSLASHHRELAILLIAKLNGAQYEFEQHVPFALDAGITREQIDALSQWRSARVFKDAQRAVLDYTETMTRSVQVPDHVYEAMRAQFSEREVVELTATIGGYNMVSRFLEAMQIHNE